MNSELSDHAEARPVPMTPQDCNLRGLPWMPLETGRLLDSDLFLLSTGDEFKAAVALWCKSWNQIPGGSLPNDERLLEALSGAKAWKKVRAMAMRGWVLCSDGRLYHPVVAELAVQAWEGRQDHMEVVDAKKTRQQRWREQIKDLSAKLRAVGVTPPMNATKAELERLVASYVDGRASTKASTSVSTEPSTPSSHVDATETASKGEGQGELIPSVPDGTGSAAAKSPADATKAELWAAGKSLLSQSGMPSAQCGSFVVKDYGDEIVIEAVRAAVVEQPADPAEWLKATCMRTAGQPKRGTRSGKHSGFDQLDYLKGVSADGRIL